MKEKLLEVKDLKTYFFTRRGILKAVDGVSFSLDKGETLALVGESGSGKSITCLSILRLIPEPAAKIVGGQILMEGEDLLEKTEKEMRQIRGKQISMILQDPMTSLNPVFTVGYQVGIPIRLHQGLTKGPLRQKVLDMLHKVHIPAPEMRIRDYPHQMSGGMRQRIVGAMALSCQPQLLIADEPTTALDVTIQAQFLRLLKEIQQTAHISMIVVTHDFGIVARVCDRVAVMYAGKVVECAETGKLFVAPAHPYTAALLASLPKMDERKGKLHAIEGQAPDLVDLPPGCAFEPRCNRALAVCGKEPPPEHTVEEGHTMSCWLKHEGGGTL